MKRIIFVTLLINIALISTNTMAGNKKLGLGIITGNYSGSEVTAGYIGSKYGLAFNAKSVTSNSQSLIGSSVELSYKMRPKFSLFAGVGSVITDQGQRRFLAEDYRENRDNWDELTSSASNFELGNSVKKAGELFINNIAYGIKMMNLNLSAGTEYRFMKQFSGQAKVDYFTKSAHLGLNYLF